MDTQLSVQITIKLVTSCVQSINITCTPCTACMLHIQICTQSMYSVNTHAYPKFVLYATHGLRIAYRTTTYHILFRCGVLETILCPLCPYSVPYVLQHAQISANSHNQSIGGLIPSKVYKNIANDCFANALKFISFSMLAIKAL